MRISMVRQDLLTGDCESFCMQEAIDYYLSQSQPLEVLRLMGLQRPSPIEAQEYISLLLSRCPLSIPAERLENYLLATQGRPSREHLAGLLDCDDSTLIVEVLEELARAGPPLDAEPILGKLDDSDPEVALAAAKVAIKCLPKEQLSELARTRLDSPIGMQIAQAVPSLFPQLLEGLLQPSTAAQAARSLAELCINDLGPNGLVLRQFWNENPDLPSAAWAGLGFLDTDWVSEFVPQLQKVLSDSALETHWRWRALLSLQSLNELPAEVLRPLLHDPAEDMRYHCLEALAESEAMAAALEREESNQFKQLALQFFLDHDCREYADLVLTQSEEDDRNIKALYKKIVKAWGLKAPKAKHPPAAWKKQGLQDLEALRKFLETTRLKPLAEEIVTQALPSRRLLAEGKGRSKLGGLPDLPADLNWPVGYRFVAQLDMAEVGLAQSGMLFFFVHPEQYVEGDFQVLWAEKAGQTSSAQGPVYPEVPLLARAEFSLPSAFSNFAFKSGRLRDSYRALLEQLGLGLESPTQRVGGHPNWIQGELADLELLLQVDSHPEMTWGDGGRLFFLIPTGARERGEWQQAVLEFQGY